MGNLANRENVRKPYWHEILMLFRLCLHHGLLNQGQFVVKWPSLLLLLLHDALEEGVLDPRHDAEAIRRAHDLLAQSGPQKYSKLLQSGYLPPPP
jgi:hypothetical protein